MRPSISLHAFHERRKRQLCLDHVTKIFAGGTRALDDVSASLMTGLNCVVGPTGAGKSTLLNVISGRERPSRGTLRLGAVDGVRNPMLLQSLVAHVPMDSPVPPPVPVSVALEHFAAQQEPRARLRQALVDEQLRQLDLWHVRTLRVGELTPAMHWRLMVAIALLGAPQLLLVDEPACELDDTETGALMDVLEVVADDRIVIMATSNAHLLRDRCAHVLILNRGRIARDGAADRMVDDLRGRVWKASVLPEAAGDVAHRHHVLSTHNGNDATTVVVLADEQPGAEFVLVEPDLTHVYQYDLAHSS